MSTSEFAAADDESYVEGDTQPTSEILSALAGVNNSPVKTEPQPEPQQPPPSEYDTLTAQLSENPHNPDGWRRLIRLAEDSRNLDKISAAYDALLKQYPNNVCGASNNPRVVIFVLRSVLDLGPSSLRVI